MKKAISPLIAGVILVAFTIAVAIIVTSALTSVMKSQTESTTKAQTCPSAALDMIDSRCVDGTIKVTISNIGSVELSNFTIFADIGGETYLNSNPVNGITILAPGQSVTLEAATSYTGEIAKLRVATGGDCSGVYIEKTNTTTDIATC